MIAILLPSYFVIVFTLCFWEEQRIGADDARTTSLPLTGAGDNLGLAIAMAMGV